MSQPWFCPKCGPVREKHTVATCVGTPRWLCVSCDSEVSPYEFTSERPTKPDYYWVWNPMFKNRFDLYFRNPHIHYFDETEIQLPLLSSLYEGCLFAPVAPHPALKEVE